MDKDLSGCLFLLSSLNHQLNNYMLFRVGIREDMFA